jgi:hypothetical protein
MILSEQRLAEIDTKHAANPAYQRLKRASNAYWAFAARVADYFLQALGRVRSRNPFIGIAGISFVFIAGFMVVPPLYLVVGPLVQLGIVLVAIFWICLAGVFGRHHSKSPPVTG